ncbi:hypothetical protein Tco_1104677 [Tanacetum coccineum]
MPTKTMSKYSSEPILPASKDSGDQRFRRAKIPTAPVGPALCSNTDFKRRLCDIVWTDKIEADVFDEQWKEIMEEFGLSEHKPSQQEERF